MSFFTMEQIRDLAIVLRWAPYEERHRVVTALTENHGKISALARNSIQSRRFGGSLEPFVASEWRFVERRGAELYRVEEAEVKRPFEGLRADFTKLSLASVFNELMLKIAPEREACSELFRLHSNALAILEETKMELGTDVALLNAYMAKILQWSGSQPQLSYCLSCQSPLQALEPQMAVNCIVADAGWVCPTCRTEVSGTRHVTGREGAQFQNLFLKVTSAALADFQMFLMTPIKQVLSKQSASRQELVALFKFVDALFVYHMPGFDQKPLKSLKFLNLEPSVPPPGASRRQSPLLPA